MKNVPSSILITGGAGFIGSSLLRYLWKRWPETVFHVLDVLTYAGDINNIDPEIHSSSRFHFWYGDVRDQRLVDSLVGQVEHVIHFAAETHVTRSIYEDSKFFETDVLGTRMIANAVLRNQKNIKRFVHISTSEVYGTAEYEPMDENHPLNPQSPYAAAKTGADRLVYSYINTFGIPAVIVRPFNVFGPHQHLEKLIPRFITSAIMGQPMTIHGTGDSQRDFTYIEEVVKAFEIILLAPDEIINGQTVNIASGRSVSVLEIANLIKKYMEDGFTKLNLNNFAINVGDRPGQVFKHIGSAEKIKKLGWYNSTSFEEGLKNTIQWYIDNREWWKNKIWMEHVPILTKDNKIEFH